MRILDRLQRSTLLIFCANVYQRLTMHAEFEMMRLEQRYMHRQNRSGFSSDTRYVDGEYVYGKETTTRADVGDKRASRLAVQRIESRRDGGTS